MHTFTLTELWAAMGTVARGVVILLLAMSVHALAVGAERVVAYRRGRGQSRAYVLALRPLLDAGRLRDAAGLDQHWRASPIARVIGAGVGEFVHGLNRLGPRAADAARRDAVVDLASSAMARVMDRELMGLRRGLPALATVSSSAPFVGLLGTVFGIITAFKQMAAAKGAGGLDTVSAGIAEALLTTAVGLTVAIAAVWLFNHFSTTVERITVDVEETAGEVLDCMKRELSS